MLVGMRACARVCPSTFLSEGSGKLEVGSASLGVGMVNDKKSLW